jgi:hypothetical protein
LTALVSGDAVLKAFDGAVPWRLDMPGIDPLAIEKVGLYHVVVQVHAQRVDVALYLGR